MEVLVERYLRELVRIRSSGAAVEETSYYPVLSDLLNGIGKQLKPQVFCIMTIKNQGAGLPDGGLFTNDQLQTNPFIDLMSGPLPAAGVIEVKGTSDDAWMTAEGDQVSKYWKRYKQVLVTNYRDFLLIGQDNEGRPLKLESFRLAESENAFWAAAVTSHKTAKMLGERFISYLKRVMLQYAPLSEPRDIAWFLASYAREAKSRIEKKDLPALYALRNELENSLGIKFEGQRGDHFFRSTLVQTLFYGIFSAWVLWSKQQVMDSKDSFHWRSAVWSLQIPMVRGLFEQIATPTMLGPLGISVILDWAELALKRIDRKIFLRSLRNIMQYSIFMNPFLKRSIPNFVKNWVYGILPLRL